MITLIYIMKFVNMMKKLKVVSCVKIVMNLTDVCSTE